MSDTLAVLSRRSALGLLAAGLAAACTSETSRGGKLFVGDQRGGSKVVLQGAGKLSHVPYEIVWSQFPNAAPLLEALNAGAIDSGIGGDSAFIFSIGSGATIKAIGAQETKGMGPVVLVRRDSPIRSLADLAGKKVATPRGSVSHNHVLAVLEAYGHPYDAVTFAFLSPSDGRAALQSGAVDAWAIWDPNAAMAEKEGARILPGKQDLVPRYALMFGRDGAIADKKPLLQDYHDRLYAGWDWAARNPDAYSDLMHRDTGLALDIVRISNGRANRVPVKIDAVLIAEQQRTADRYFKVGLIARRVDVRTAFDTSFS
jgi:sulfonate transport system substrate-binding protein